VPCFFTSELEFMFAKFRRPPAIPKIFFKIKGRLIVNYYAISYGISFKQNCLKIVFLQMLRLLFVPSFSRTIFRYNVILIPKYASHDFYKS
jgi:hypothetical protein